MPSSDLPFHPIDDVRRDLLNLADGHLELVGPAIPGIHQVDGVLAAGREDSIDLVDPWYGGPHEFQVAIGQIQEVAPYIVDWVERQIG